MTTLAEYHQAAAAWVRQQRGKLGTPEEPESHDTLSAQIGYHTGAKISGETLRWWEALKLKKRISGEKEEAIAAYCQATGQDHPAWLPRRNVPQAAANDPIEYIRQATPGRAGEVAEIAAAAIRWLVQNGFGGAVDRPYPATQDQAIAAVLAQADFLIREMLMPVERWVRIVAGDRPTMGEAAMISRLFTPPGDADRVMALYLPPPPDPQKPGSQAAKQASKMKK
jgi:hypothetical protein